MKAWLFQHRAALTGAVRRLWKTPLNTLLSLSVIGIVLTLPAAGWTVLDNLRQLGGGSSGLQQISIYLQLDATRKDVAELEARLKAARAGNWRLIAKEDALKRLQQSAGMGDVVASLPRNPLPDAFVVEPDDKAPEALEALRQTFAAWPKVAHVQLDSAWVRRFDAFLRLGKVVVTLLAGLFAAGFVAVTFNTIRLQVVSQATEIELARLLGATDAFIRRPFSYFGALQGGLGGVLAAGLVFAGLRLLNGPVGELAALYGSRFTLAAPGALEVAVLVTVGAALGWLGAQISVSLALRRP